MTSDDSSYIHALRKERLARYACMYVWRSGKEAADGRIQEVRREESKATVQCA